MITNKKIAAEIGTLMLNLGREIDASIALVQSTCNESEFNEYRRAAGKVMGYMYADILRPLYRINPELKPEGLDDG